MSTNVFACAAAGGGSCPRCKDGSPHAPGISLGATIRALVYAVGPPMHPTDASLKIMRQKLKSRGIKSDELERKLEAWQLACQDCAHCGALPFATFGVRPLPPPDLLQRRLPEGALEGRPQAGVQAAVGCDPPAVVLHTPSLSCQITHASHAVDGVQ